MTVGYKKAIGIAFVALGLINIVLGILTKNPIGVFVPGFVCMTIGISTLVRPILVLEGNRLTVKALIGPLGRTYEFDSYAQFEVEPGGRLFLVRNGERKRIGVSRAFADTEDWQKFIDEITGNTV